MEVLWPPVQPPCKRAARCTSSHAVHVQINSLHPIRCPCCMLPRVALIVHSRLQLSPSLAWRLHGLPEYLHGMLGEGQPPPCVEAHALKRCARAKQQSTPHTLPVLHAASRCTHRAFTLTIEPLACTAAARAPEAAPRHARQGTTTTTHGGARLHTLCTC